jgi:oligoendopeptidase F
MPHDALPRWDLSALYATPHDPRLTDDRARIRTEVEGFASAYRGTIATLNALALHDALRRYETLQEALGKLSSYADLLFSTDSITPSVVALTQNLNEFVSDCASALVFFTLELNVLSEQALQDAFATHPPLAQYAPWLRDLRVFRPHQLDEALEKLFVDKAITSEAAWVRLYEDISNRMKVTVEGKALTLAEALDLLSHPKEPTRKAAAIALSGAFTERADQFTLIFNTLIKDKAIEDAWRGYARPVSSRNLANLVEDTVVDALTDTVTAQYQALSERYYLLKARLLGKERLAFWDRNAPLPHDDDASISWEDARDMVLSAYRAFSPDMADIAERFFTEGWIDAPVVEGKTSGAFSHPTVPSAHPYILMNYQGKVRDVMTLAHELGHGVHQVLSSGQGALMADTPLTLAETASVFGEQLTFQYLLSREQHPQARIRLLAGKVEDMLNTVVRQIAFYRFEEALHDARREGELSADVIAEHWMRTQAESFGRAIDLDNRYRPFWMYVSHFFHTPFYVYAYAFGDCLVNALYAIYLEEQAAGRAAVFEQRYLDMLRAGGTLRHKELLAPFGIDITRPDFWSKGLSHISSLIDALERELA